MVGVEGNQPVNRFEEAIKTIIGQAGNQIQVQLNVTVVTQVQYIFLEFCHVDIAIDGLEGTLRGGLHADFKLESVFRYLGKQFQGRFIKEMAGNFKVEMSRLIVLQDETENISGPFSIVVEGAIDQLDLGNLVLHQKEQIAVYTLH